MRKSQMEMMFRFKTDSPELLRIIGHTYRNPSHRVMVGWDDKRDKAIYEDRETPELVLVKDEGVYIMSASKGCYNEEKKMQYVIYAEGHDPEIDDFDDWWVGGDDFGIQIPAEWVKNAIGKDAETFTLSVSDSRVSFYTPE